MPRVYKYDPRAKTTRNPMSPENLPVMCVDILMPDTSDFYLPDHMQYGKGKAGKPSADPIITAATCLQCYNVQSQVDALKHDAGIFEERRPSFKYKLPHLKNFRHCGVYTDCRKCMERPAKTRYQTLIDDLKETSYDSYWHKFEGKTRDPLPNLPAGMDTITTTYGSPTIRPYSVREVVNPSKTVYQVLWDSQVGHDMYKKTHNDYNPGEQTDRGYSVPPFDPKKRYGHTTGLDNRGIMVRCACHWHDNEPITCVNSIQADVEERLQPRAGKVLAPVNNIASVPKGFMFGKPCKRELYGMEELLKDANCPPCIFKRDFQEWMTQLNKLRNYLKKRFNTFGFDLKEFESRVRYFDKELTGWVPLKLFYDICNCSDVKYEHEALEPFFKFVGVILDDKINYRDFVFLVNIHSSVPEIIKIENVPQACQYYLSTFQAAACDCYLVDNSKKPTAGIPSIRNDLPRPKVPEGGCKADLESLGDETSSAAIVSPSIFTNYGITYRDFYMPRSPEVMRKIFENIGYEFPDDTFDKLWKIGVERDKTGLVCVDTFRQLMRDTLPPPRLILKDDVIC